MSSMLFIFCISVSLSLESQYSKSVTYLTNTFKSSLRSFPRCYSIMRMLLLAVFFSPNKNQYKKYKVTANKRPSNLQNEICLRTQSNFDSSEKQVCSFCLQILAMQAMKGRCVCRLFKCISYFYCSLSICAQRSEKHYEIMAASEERFHQVKSVLDD